MSNALLIYLYDIIVYGKTFGVHLKHLEEVLQRLKNSNLKTEFGEMYFLSKRGILSWSSYFRRGRKNITRKGKMHSGMAYSNQHLRAKILHWVV